MSRQFFLSSFLRSFFSTTIFSHFTDNHQHTLSKMEMFTFSSLIAGREMRQGENFRREKCTKIVLYWGLIKAFLMIRRRARYLSFFPSLATGLNFAKRLRTDRSMHDCRFSFLAERKIRCKKTVQLQINSRERKTFHCTFKRHED